MIYYVSPKINKWSSLTFGGNQFAALCKLTDGKSEDGAIGFLAIYETLEEYRAQYPDVEPMMVSTETL